MSRKIALTAASAAAALTLTVALAAAGFAPGAPATAAASASAVDQIVTDPAPTVQVDTVYLAPAQEPEAITIHKVLKASGGEEASENESEHESDD
jgi:hypothetical protein